MTASDAVLDVHQRVVNVPRAALQMTARAPGVWAIVPRLGSARQLPHSWGARYGMCLQCHARAPLPKGPLNMSCGKCGGVFDVGWGDAYDA